MGGFHSFTNKYVYLPPSLSQNPIITKDLTYFYKDISYFVVENAPDPDTTIDFYTIRLLYLHGNNEDIDTCYPRIKKLISLIQDALDPKFKNCRILCLIIDYHKEMLQ